MQRGYVLANVALDSVVTINKKNKNFDMLLVTKSGEKAQDLLNRIKRYLQRVYILKFS